MFNVHFFEHLSLIDFLIQCHSVGARGFKKTNWVLSISGNLWTWIGLFKCDEVITIFHHHFEISFFQAPNSRKSTLLLEVRTPIALAILVQNLSQVVLEILKNTQAISSLRIIGPSSPLILTNPRGHPTRKTHGNHGGLWNLPEQWTKTLVV